MGTMPQTVQCGTEEAERVLRSNTDPSRVDRSDIDRSNIDSLNIGAPSLDPADWKEFRAQAHRMLDDMLDYTKNIRERPVWQAIPDEVRHRFAGAVPVAPGSLAEVHQEFMKYILPFAAGNVHPGFMGWVQGGGTPVGMLAEMLAAGLNANLGGRDQIPIEVECQIARWMQGIFGFPETAAGLFVSGTSMANFIAVVVARDAAGGEVRRAGVAGSSRRLRAYGSAAAHGCVEKAMDLCGLGSDALRRIPVDDCGRMDLTAIGNAIAQDRREGFEPFLVVGTAGTVDRGAIDNLAGLADLARREKIWFHVDGAFGALAMLAPKLAPKLRGIERADSLAFDFHKWGQVPYDAGFILVRDGALQRNAFAASSSYLRRETRGLAAGTFWPCDYGPELSRGFRALKTWFTLKVYGTEAIGAAIARTCELARYLEERIANESELELLAPVELNIVCFRYRAEDSDRVNAEIVVELQELGVVAPSTTVIDGKLAIRAAIVNHRTSQVEIDKLISGTLSLGRRLTGEICRTSRALKAAEIGPQVRWEQELQSVEHELELSPASICPTLIGPASIGPESIDARFRRALLLSQLGRLMEAVDDYIKVLERDPSHLEALNNLGSVLVSMERRAAAKMAYREAVLRHPKDAMSRVNFGQFLLEEAERLTVCEHGEDALALRREARGHFEEALKADADFEKAHEGLSYVLRHLGAEQEAAWHRRQAFRNRPVMALPYCGRGQALAVLKLASTRGGNVKLQRFLDPRIFQTFIVLPEFSDRTTALPAHRLVVNAIGDAEVSGTALEAAARVLELTDAPVINSPAAVLATSRSYNASRLSHLPGVVTPVTALLPREQLCWELATSVLTRHGLEFPLLLRAPGFHTGLHFLRVEGPEEMADALGKLPGSELIVMQYLDACGLDGKTRKYRVMMIDGELYPVHCAISKHWKIHYFTAEMAENPENRAEDAAFLKNMPLALGPLAMRALEAIQATLGLDYGGIDFGLNARGEVLVFEANATMVVNPPEPDARWSYRLPAYQRIHRAVQRMFLARIGGHARAMAQGA
jgi:aromatic-L-amino-acid decarboxylase